MDPLTEVESPSGEGSRSRMRGVDRAWLRMDEPTNLMVINGVILFEERLELDRIRQVLDQRLLGIDRFRQRVVEEKGRCYWEEDPDFDLDRHLVMQELPGEGGEAELQQVVGDLMGEPLPYDQPLWRLHVFTNFEQGTATLWRLHHCIGDGIALTLVLLSLTDLASVVEAGEEAGSLEDRNPLAHLFRKGQSAAQQAREHLERVLPEAVKLLTKPAEMRHSTSRWVKGLVAIPTFGRMSLRSRDPKTVFKGPLSVAKRVAWSEKIPLEGVHQLRRRLGGTVNDVLLTAVAGGLRRYLQQEGRSTSGIRLRGVVPVSLRPLERLADLGNHFGLVFLSLPVGIESPTDRLEDLRRRMSSLKTSMEPLVVFKILGALGISPRRVQDLVVRIFGSKATAVMTNVPGPKEVLYFADRPIDRLVFWVPQSGRLGMGISIFSYAGEVTVAVVTDAGLVPDPQRIINGFHLELDELDRLASASA